VEFCGLPLPVSMMPQFLRVVQQHILGVVGSVVHYFLGNLTEFLAVKEF